MAEAERTRTRIFASEGISLGFLTEVKLPGVTSVGFPAVFQLLPSLVEYCIVYWLMSGRLTTVPCSLLEEDDDDDDDVADEDENKDEKKDKGEGEEPLLEEDGDDDDVADEDEGEGEDEGEEPEAEPTVV